jgi:hypothetical protein
LDLSGSRNKLTKNIYRIGNVRLSDTKVKETPYNLTIVSRILIRLTIIGSNVNIELHGSLNNPVISKRSLIKKIMNILLLRQKITSQLYRRTQFQESTSEDQDQT